MSRTAVAKPLARRASRGGSRRRKRTVEQIIFTSMLAYALSRKEFIFRRSITLIFVLTLYFDAGLIPNYLLIKDLGMLNSFQAYWVPTIISAFNLIILRTYMKSIPDEIIESA